MFFLRLQDQSLPKRRDCGTFGLHLVGAGITVTKLIGFVAAAVVFACSAAAVQAQPALKQPAERPPEGYTGSQYVDSTGCAYIRAGTAGAVTWVPRVTRDRRQVCGFAPTFPKTASRQQQTGDTKRAAPSRQKTSERVDPVVMVPAAGMGMSGAAGGVGTVVTPQNAAAKGVSPHDRVLPRHLYERRKAEKPVITPKGFRPAWQDGRMNRRRAEQTLAGRAQMLQIWTNTVPRRLIEKP